MTSAGSSRPGSGPPRSAEGLSLGPGQEFDLIRSLAGGNRPLSPGVRVGPGDDCAVLEGGVLVSVDLSVEGVHFRRDWFSLEDAGYRAAAGALSDLAAMAAEPLGVLLSMSLAEGEAREVARAFQTGAGEACRREGIQILGGDVTRSPGPAFLDVVVLGRAEEPLLRGGSRPGDRIWVTGWLGGSGAAIQALSRGLEAPEALRDRLVRPRPRIQEMLWLRTRAELHAAIDLSDGLAGDAGHLSAAGGVALVLEAADIPLDPGLESLVADSSERLHLGLGGGEDYEVCFTAPPGQVEALADDFREAFGIPLTCIGAVEDGGGARLRERDGEIRDLSGGFDHLSTKEAG